MEGGKKRMGRSNQNEGEGEGPRKGRGERQDEAPPIDETRLRETLKKNHFCRGIGGSRGRRYQCGNEEITEEERDRAVELLAEAVRRWHVWEKEAWFHKYREEFLVIRNNVEKLRDKYGDKVSKVCAVIDGFIRYLDLFEQYWLKVRGEVKRIIDDLMCGRAIVVVKSGIKSFGVVVYGEFVSLDVHKPGNRGIVVALELNSFKGTIIEVPNIWGNRKFIRKLIKALRAGFAATDEGKKKRKPLMDTTQLWQLILWALLYPGAIYVSIRKININKKGVTITWRLTAKNNRSIKDAAFKVAKSLSKEFLFAFIFTSILGDGSVQFIHHDYGEEPMIAISTSDSMLDKWKAVLDRLGIRWYEDKRYVGFFSSSAITVAKMIISVLPQMLKDLLDTLNIKKWETLKKVAGMNVRFVEGENQVTVGGINFTARIGAHTVELIHKVKSKDEGEIIRMLLRSVYGEKFMANIYRSNRYFVVAIPMYVYEEIDEISKLVIKVLCKKLGKAKDEEKKRRIARAISRLARTPTEGAAAAGGYSTSTRWLTS